MDLTRLAVDAGQFINRAVQYTGETFGTAEKTDLEPDLEELFAKADATKTFTDEIITQTEALLQPNPAARLEDRLYEQLEWRAPPRPRTLEVLGDLMTNAGLELGSNNPYGSALVKFGETQKQLGETERKFAQSTNIHFLTPLRSFTEGEYRTMQDERKTLTNKRLDLDIAKTRVRKAHEADREARSLNANPLEEDYFAQVSYMFSFIRVKWLKMWAQEINQAEMELRICQSLFDRQTEITKRLLQGLDDTHMNHIQSLNEFVETQTCYFDECNQLSQELQKQLESLPAVLCSNNWQSAITNGVTTTDNQEAPSKLNLENPIVLHKIPDFDQDSWTLQPETRKIPDLLNGTELSTHANMNNSNNNTSSTDSQNASHCLEAPANQTCAPNPQPKNRLLRTDTTTISDDDVNSEILEVDQVTSGEASNAEPQANGNTVETVESNSTEAEPIVFNGETNELPPTSEEDTET